MRVTSIPIHLVRAVDRHGGFTVRRGEAAYARGAPRFVARLHQRILDDAGAVLGTGPALVVDVGSGPGTLTSALGRIRPESEVIGVEPNPRMLAIARSMRVGRNVRFEHGCAEHLPLPSGTVDLLVSSLSVHHWSDLSVALAEIVRVLRPTGVAWLYDVRFATATAEELRAAAIAAGLPQDVIARRVPPHQGRLPLLARIELTHPAAHATARLDPAQATAPTRAAE